MPLQKSILGENVRLYGSQEKLHTVSPVQASVATMTPKEQKLVPKKEKMGQLML